MQMFDQRLGAADDRAPVWASRELAHIAGLTRVTPCATRIHEHDIHVALLPGFALFDRESIDFFSFEPSLKLGFATIEIRVHRKACSANVASQTRRFYSHPTGRARPMTIPMTALSRRAKLLSFAQCHLFFTQSVGVDTMPRKPPTRQ